MRKPILTARWESLVLLNFDCPRGLLEPLVPFGTELDSWHGSDVVSLVGFRFCDTRLKGIALPGHRTFEEVNLRFYVRRTGPDGELRRAVVFIKELVPRRAIAAVARLLYNEPYATVPMSNDVALDSDCGGHASYSWRFDGQDYSVGARAMGPSRDLVEGSEAEFITEHYWGYTRQKDGSTLEYRVEHPSWRVWEAEEARYEHPLATELYGAGFSEVLRAEPRSAFVAEGSHVKVYAGTLLRDGGGGTEPAQSPPPSAEPSVVGIGRAPYSLGVDLVRELIASQFPAWTHLPIRTVEPNGWDNLTFRLGSEMSVRLPSREAYAAQVAKEQEWLPKLEPSLPLAIPVPLAMGVPGAGYPWHWSIYRWLEGETAAVAQIEDLTEFASSLAEFLAALQRVDPTDGPVAGPHSFYRGGALQTYDDETRAAIATLQHHVDADRVTAVWERALESQWEAPAVWVHGDLAATNVLVAEGKLHAVIDFGCSALGDPACDLTIAWTFFSGESRKAFRRGVSLDRATWARARGWALWKALITLAECLGTDASKASEASRVIGEVLADHEHHT